MPTIVRTPLPEVPRRSAHAAPRLLTITPDFPPGRGGVQLLLARLVEHLPGWDHHVVTRGRSLDAPWPMQTRTQLADGVASLAELQARALAAGLRIRPDAVLNGHVTTTPAALALGRVLRRPVLTYLYSDEIPKRPRLARAAVSGSTAAVAISRHAHRLAIEAGAASDKLAIVPPGVDPLPVDAEHAADGARDPRLLVTISRLATSRKGHDVVLAALRRMRVPDVRWVVIGDGPLRPTLEHEARRAGLADSVHFVGECSDAERAKWLTRASVFVMPSRLPRHGGGEGFGIVYLEAALHGVPAVAGNVGGALDAIIDGETGILVDPTNPGAVADALTTLLESPTLRDAMGDAARARAQTFTWTRMASSIDGMLKTAMGSHRRA